MYAKFEDLLRKSGMTPYKVSKATGIATATLSDWKNGKSTPKKDKLDLIANFFKVPPSYFSDIPPQYCPECGEEFEPYGESAGYHDVKHAKWERAVEKFGFCWPHVVCENAKVIARTKLTQNKELSKEDRIELREEIFKALYSRSLSSNDFSLEHPDFENYAAMLLNQRQFDSKIDSETRQAMVEKYGTIPGINEGETYYHVPRKIKKTTPLPSIVTYEDTKKLIARNGKALTTEQRMELIKLLSEIK